MEHLSFKPTNFTVYLKIPDTSWAESTFEILRWVEQNIEKPGLNYYFQEMNIGLTHYTTFKTDSTVFDPSVHNCISLNFRHRTDIEYVILVWGDKLYVTS